eukprot:scaffold13937_cov108-Isochrysis_galbana.AAC.5
MGDAYEYPEIRAARFQYAMLWLPPSVRADYGLREQWINKQQSDLPRGTTSTRSFSRFTTTRTTAT